jgi:hypothetical protein
MPCFAANSSEGESIEMVRLCAAFVTIADTLASMAERSV